mmetsp:Transcript_9250/g.30549  ORF Transcript_9250/g.30549 Transcript_9250/m.30549 type:complete len:219 (-) Transcript_9250:151-807(-)
MSGERPSFLSRSASLAHAVVFPTPWSPAMSTTVGPSSALASGTFSRPISSRSSSATTLTSCWSGVTPLVTLTPSERSSTFFTKRRTTGRLTSASSKARRISLMGALMLSALSSVSPLSRSQLFSSVVLMESKASARTTKPLPSRRAGGTRHRRAPATKPGLARTPTHADPPCTFSLALNDSDAAARTAAGAGALQCALARTAGEPCDLGVRAARTRDV